MVAVEICIDCTQFDLVSKAVDAAYLGGAERIELCAEMQHEGLTPIKEHIRAAREAFRRRRGLLVMVRPRKGNFCYTGKELTDMETQIAMAAEAGADGVVFGALTSNGKIDRAALARLQIIADNYGLSTTFHRAFDVMKDYKNALSTLIDVGVNRVLTSGTPWGENKGAIDGLDRLSEIITAANGDIEVVVGGGVSAENVENILEALWQEKTPISIHAFSGAQVNNQVTFAGIHRLVHATRNAIVSS